jgi:hypothetical protein
MFFDQTAWLSIANAPSRAARRNSYSTNPSVARVTALHIEFWTVIGQEVTVGSLGRQSAIDT